jgi:RNA-directed DNA polymerase
MPWLCSDRSRSYPGRPARQAVQLTLDSVLHGNVQGDQAGVSGGHSSSSMRDEGPNPEKEKARQAQSGMTNKWLKEQGLLSVKELWVSIHYPATAR